MFGVFIINSCSIKFDTGKMSNQKPYSYLETLVQNMFFHPSNLITQTIRHRANKTMCPMWLKKIQINETLRSPVF